MDPALALMGLYLLLIDLLLLFVFPSLSLVLAAFSLDIDTSRDPTSFLSFIKASRYIVDVLPSLTYSFFINVEHITSSKLSEGCRSNWKLWVCFVSKITLLFILKLTSS